MITIPGKHLGSSCHGVMKKQRRGIRKPLRAELRGHHSPGARRACYPTEVGPRIALRTHFNVGGIEAQQIISRVHLKMF